MPTLPTPSTVLLSTISTAMATAVAPALSKSGAEIATTAALRARNSPRLTGVVISAGRMQRAVKVRTTKQRFDTFLQRHYAEHPAYLVSDPADSLRTGDVVRIAPWRQSKRIAHVVTEIVKPFGPAVSERPAVPHIETLIAVKQSRWEAKQERRATRELAEAEARRPPSAVAAENEADGVVQQQDKVTGEMSTGSDLTGRRIDETRRDALENERQAELLEEQADKQGVDLEKRVRDMRM